MQQRCRGGINRHKQLRGSAYSQALYHYKIDKQGNARNITFAAENVFVKALMTKVALAVNDPHKCYSASISPIDENNDSVSKSWIVFRHRIVAKPTFARSE